MLDFLYGKFRVATCLYQTGLRGFQICQENLFSLYAIIICVEKMEMEENRGFVSRGRKQFHVP